MRRFSGDGTVAVAAVVLVAGLSLLPMVRLAAEAAQAELLAEVFAAPSFWRALERSLITSLGGSAVGLAIGAVFAIAVGPGGLPGRRLLSIAVLLPLLIPSQIMALAWIELFAPVARLSGWLGMPIPAGTPNPLYSPGGIILLLGVEQAPVSFLTIRAGLLAIPPDLVEAAEAAGARRLRILGAILLPLLAPAIAAGYGLAFVACLGNFGIPALLGIPARYPTLPVLIYQRLAGFGPAMLAEAAAMALGLGIIAAAVMLAVTRTGGGVAAPGAGGTARARPWLALGRGRWAAAIGLAAVALVMTLLPLAALLATALTRAYGLDLTADTVTIDHFRRVVGQPQTARALWNSLWLSLVAALLLGAVALPVAVAGAWSRRAGLRRLLAWLDPVIELPYALPGVILAIAVILVYLKPLPILGIGLYGTAAIILLAYLARFLPLALRPVQAMLRQIDRALDEAAEACGARARQRLAWIALPLLLPAGTAAALLVFLTAFSELTVSALLWSRGTETVGVAIFFLEESGDMPGAAAVSVVCLMLLFGLAACAGRLLPDTARRLLPWAA